MVFLNCEIMLCLHYQPYWCQLSSYCETYGSTSLMSSTYQHTLIDFHAHSLLILYMHYHTLLRFNWLSPFCFKIIVCSSKGHGEMQKQKLASVRHHFHYPSSCPSDEFQEKILKHMNQIPLGGLRMEVCWTG